MHLVTYCATVATVSLWPTVIFAFHKPNALKWVRVLLYSSFNLTVFQSFSWEGINPAKLKWLSLVHTESTHDQWQLCREVVHTLSHYSIVASQLHSGNFWRGRFTTLSGTKVNSKASSSFSAFVYRSANLLSTFVRHALKKNTDWTLTINLLQCCRADTMSAPRPTRCKLFETGCIRAIILSSNIRKIIWTVE